jgi:hypothetical protein
MHPDVLVEMPTNELERTNHKPSVAWMTELEPAG